MVVRRKRAKRSHPKAAKDLCSPENQMKTSHSEEDPDSSQQGSSNVPSNQNAMQLPHPSSEISQLELIALACGSDLKLSSDDDKWTCGYKRRNIMRNGVKDVIPSRKNVVIYHKNNFHFTLKDKWSKLVTDKISALAFSRSLRGYKN